MHRPWQIWTTFAACLLLLVAAVAWLSVKALESDEAEAAARRQAAIEENARLALWRMDTLLAPLIAQEGAIPYYEYWPFHSKQELIADGADWNGSTPVDGANPSIFLQSHDPMVRIHFQTFTTPAGEGVKTAPSAMLTSPEVPVEAAHARAVPNRISEEQYRENAQWLAELNKSVNAVTLAARLPRLPLGIFTSVASGIPQPTPTAQDPSTLPAVRAEPESKFQSQFQAGSQYAQPIQPTNGEDSPPQVANSPATQQVRSQTEYQARQRFVETNSFNANGGQAMTYVVQNGGPLYLPPPGASTVMKPLWINGQLLLARRVKLGTYDNFVQGALLNWPGLKQRLLAEVADLSPNADLVPAPTEMGATPNGGESRMLASLPVQLVLGDLPIAAAGLWSPVQYSLLIAWSAIALATVAVALVLRGVLSLSERRAAFVSAVTHELRTPLTTFRLYAEMLSEDMVPDETARRGYLQTLRVEAERLTHLVANVLAYARLERGALTGRIERITIERLLEVATHRISERAAQAGFTMEVDADPAMRSSEVLVDPSAVEQILFNLVDNACKYAAAAKHKTIRLTINNPRAQAAPIEIRLADRGPGVTPVAQRKLFQAFRKSAQDAAYSAPGVGLGLALSRRLARELGGDLRYEPTADGACFVLSLRVA